MGLGTLILFSIGLVNRKISLENAEFLHSRRHDPDSIQGFSLVGERHIHNTTTYTFYQIECRIHAVQCEWCRLIKKTGRDMFVTTHCKHFLSKSKSRNSKPVTTEDKTKNTLENHIFSILPSQQPYNL